jgi:UDP-N-acetylglucosamine 2-epimerase
MHFYKNLPVEHYIHLLKKTVCLVGNSSSGIREGAFIGTPVVNIGTRQNMRERGKNVKDVPYNLDKIYNTLKQQIDHASYESEPIYGEGTAGPKIADILASVNPKVQKTITF